jgi:hypothetical protein
VLPGVTSPLPVGLAHEARTSLAVDLRLALRRGVLVRLPLVEARLGELGEAPGHGLRRPRILAPAAALDEDVRGLEPAVGEDPRKLRARTHGLVPPTHTLVQNGDISTKPRPYSYNRNGTFSSVRAHGLAIVIPVENFTERNYPLGRHDSLLATFRETLALNPNAPGPIFHCTTLHDARSFVYTIRKDHGLRYTVIEDPDTHLFRIAPTAEPLPKVSLKPKKKKPTKTSLTRTHLDHL